MCKILFVITDLSSGGAEIMLYHLLRGMDRNRFELEVITLLTKTTKLGTLIEKLGVPVHSLEIHRGQIPISAIFRLRRLIRVIKPNLIQGYMYHGNLFASIGCLISNLKIPVLWSIHHVPYDLKKEKLSTAIFILLGSLFGMGASKIIFVSKISAKRHQELGYPSKRLMIIPNGFDCNEFKPSEDGRKKLRNELKIPSDSLLIGLIGRFHPMKDHENFFNAAGLLKNKYNHVEFVLAGLGVDSSNKEIQNLIVKNGLFDRVHLLGIRDDIPEIMAGVDIYTNASSSEAFPLVIGEAMACGIPCVVTDVGDSAWIVGSTGKVVPPKNPEALVEAWGTLIEAGPKERTKLGKHARHRIIEKFSIEKIVNRYELLYEQINVNARQLSN